MRLAFNFDKKPLSIWLSFQQGLIVIALLAGFTALYAYSIGIPFYSSDAQVMYNTAWELSHSGKLNVSPAPLPQLIQGHDDLIYSKYDVGLPLLASHIIYYADGVAKASGADRYAVGAIFVMFIPNICMALANVGCYLLALHISHSTRRALISALVCGLGTTVWPYGRLFFAEAITTATLTLAMVWLFVPSKLKAIHIIGAGLLMSIALISRIHTLIFAIVLFYPIWQRTQTPSQRIRYLLLYSIAFFIGSSMWFFHNWLRFGNILTTGYEGETFSNNPLAGMVGLLVSFGKGVFWYAPPLIISALSFPYFKKNASLLSKTLILSTLLAIGFYGSWWAWHGGWVWGPRFLVPLMPLWCVGWSVFPTKISWKIGATLIFSIGILVQFVGTFTNVNNAYTNAFYGASNPDDKTHYAMIHYDLDYNPILLGWQQLKTGNTEPQAIYQLQKTELNQNWVYGVPQAIERCLLLSIGILTWGLLHNPMIFEGQET